MNPLAPSHRRVLHLYPIATYEFADGVYVVAAPGRPQLVGRRLLAIQGRPDRGRAPARRPARDLRQPAVARRAPQPLPRDCRGPARARHHADGRARRRSPSRGSPTSTLMPVTRGDVRHRDAPGVSRSSSTGCRSARSRSFVLASRDASQWVTTIDRGRVVYFLYNTVLRATRRGPRTGSSASPAARRRAGSSSTCATTAAATSTRTRTSWTRSRRARSTGPGGSSC